MVMNSLLYRLGKEQDSAHEIAATLDDAAQTLLKLIGELARCVHLLDGACRLPDGSNADTRNAHALLGDFTGEK
jgi:hypothetical protein